MIDLSERVLVGYVCLAQKSKLAFEKPRLVSRSRSKPISDRAVQACPAVNAFESRLFEILSPFDMGLRCSFSRGTASIHIIPDLTRLDDELLESFIVPMPPRFWRSPNRPVLQISIPHFFVCDEVCYLNQLPPYMSEHYVQFPGLVISGRFPTHIWPRALNLAIEWVDFERDLEIKRGQPLCYLLFETERPNAPIQLVEAKLTDELREYRSEFEDIPKFLSGTFNLIEKLEAKRPPKLLVRS